MTLTLITPPAALPVSVAEAKRHARLVDEEADAFIASLVRSATAQLDGADGLLGRALITQVWEYRIDCWPWPGAISLPLPPCQSVDAVTYVDQDGITQVIPGSPPPYQVVGIGGSGPARITPLTGWHWPSARHQAGAVTITFTCGYGDTPGHVPEPLRHAICALALAYHDGQGEQEALEIAMQFKARVW